MYKRWAAEHVLCMQVWLRRNLNPDGPMLEIMQHQAITKPSQPDHRQAALRNCCSLSRMCSQPAYIALWWSSRWQMT